MNPSTAAVIRSGALLILLCLTPRYDPMPAWWWAALGAVLWWTALDIWSLWFGDNDDRDT